MKLTKQQTAFKTDEITYLDRKTIQLDRMLLNFFERLRYDGKPAVRGRRKQIDIDALANQMAELSETFPGFAQRLDVARAWLRNDLLQLQNRGKPGREAVVGPRPFHINAYKLTNASAVADFGASQQVWAMLYYADPELLIRLKSFFARGLDFARDSYDRSTPLDLETLAILGLADPVKYYPSPSSMEEPLVPLCRRQGHLLAEDLRAVLAYEDFVPRHVLASYVRTVLGLHLALFLLRIIRLVPNRIESAIQQQHPSECPCEAPASSDACVDCPYRQEMAVDLTDDPNSGPAALAAASVAQNFSGIPSFVRAVFVVNRLKEYGTSIPGFKPKTLDDLLGLLRDRDDMEGFFKWRIADLVTITEDEEESDPILESIRLAPGLSNLDKYVELIALKRMKIENKRVTELVDSLAQKNRAGGFMRQPAGRRSSRRFSLDSALLEVLAQISVVRHTEEGHVFTQPVLIDDFMNWLRTRYGFVIYAPGHRQVPPEEQGAWQRNEQAFRGRLQEIGFFVDLSDAYNSQTLRPRYSVMKHE
jgi:hypothetical protein